MLVTITIDCCIIYVDNYVCLVANAVISDVHCTHLPIYHHGYTLNAIIYTNATATVTEIDFVIIIIIIVVQHFCHFLAIYGNMLRGK